MLFVCVCVRVTTAERERKIERENIDERNIKIYLM